MIDLTKFDGHTPGPWRWEFNAKNHHVGLVGGVPAYDLTVMDFARWGMGGAQPVFLEPGTMPTLHRLSDRADWLAPIAGREHHAHWCSTVTHPDARLMAAAPALLAEVKRQAAEIEGHQQAPTLPDWLTAALRHHGAATLQRLCCDAGHQVDYPVIVEWLESIGWCLGDIAARAKNLVKAEGGAE